jgi:hypothetical protein
MRQEEPFFRALLDATVYAHIPLSDDSGRLRFIQFVRPDNGATVLPFFTDETKAYVAAQGAVQVVAISGRKLLSITHGATLMLNPNNEHCVLYPEEIDSLLRTGRVASCVSTTVTAPMGIRAPSSVPDGLGKLLTEVLRPLAFVEKACVVETFLDANPERSTLLIILEVGAQYAERAVRATVTGFQACRDDFGGPIDVTTRGHISDEPDWWANSGFTPIFDRAQINDGGHPCPLIANCRAAQDRSPCQLGGMSGQAVCDFELHADCYKHLLDANVLVPVDPDWKSGNVIPAGVDIGVQVWTQSTGSEFTPFFSSAAHVYIAAPDGLKCAEMTARELFESLPKMTFCLNPGSDAATFFSAESALEILTRYAHRAS